MSDHYTKLEEDVSELKSKVNEIHKFLLCGLSVNGKQGFKARLESLERLKTILISCISVLGSLGIVIAIMFVTGLGNFLMKITGLSH